MVLGAGNANDVDLTVLCRQFRRVHLVDIDGEALRRAASKCPQEQRRRLRLHAGIDLSGEAVERTLPASMDVVLSAGTLSQMIGAIVRAAGDSDDGVRAILALRQRHLELMVDRLRQGGRGLFVTDMVSESTAPELVETPEAGLRQLMDRLIESSNFFTGLNPQAVMRSLYANPALRERVEEIRFEGPWRWRISAQRTHLAYSIRFRRRV